MRYTVPAATLAAVALLSSSANAQLGLPTGLISGLSTSCFGGLASLLFNNADLNSCLSITGAVSNLGALSNNDSIVPAINNYLSSDLCPAQYCSNATLQSANNTISSACASDISSNSNFLPGLLQLIISYYPDVKKASCLQDTKANNQICVTQTLSNIQGTLGQNITLGEVQTLSSNTEAVTQVLSKLSSNSSAFCTDCNRAIVSILSPALTSYVTNSTLTGLREAITSGCGASFLTAGVPSDLKQSGNLATSSSGSGSGSSGTNAGSAVGASAFTAVTAVLAIGFAVLA
jgi:hypothetical protein